MLALFILFGITFTFSYLCGRYAEDTERILKKKRVDIIKETNPFIYKIGGDDTLFQIFNLKQLDSKSCVSGIKNPPNEIVKKDFECVIDMNSVLVPSERLESVVTLFKKDKYNISQTNLLTGPSKLYHSNPFNKLYVYGLSKRKGKVNPIMISNSKKTLIKEIVRYPKYLSNLMENVSIVIGLVALFFTFAQ